MANPEYFYEGSRGKIVHGIRDDTFRAYFNNLVRDYPMLTPDEEYRLGEMTHRAFVTSQALESGVIRRLQTPSLIDRFIRDGEIASELLVNHNSRWVLKVAAGFQGRGLDIQDLFQEGALGLLRATYDYDPDKSRFLSYGTPWIHQYINRAIENQARTIRLPVNKVQDINKLRARFSMLSLSLKREPTIQEIADEMEMKPGNVLQLMELARPILSLDQPATDDGDTLLGDFVENPNDSPAEQVEKQELSDRLKAALDKLSLREKRVIQLRFGLVDGKERTFGDIGEEFGVTRERIRQIESRALKKLRRLSIVNKLRDFA